LRASLRIGGDARRLAALGVPDPVVTGNLRFDLETPPDAQARAAGCARLARARSSSPRRREAGELDRRRAHRAAASSNALAVIVRAIRSVSRRGRAVA
jgi:hypothetical protein